MSSAAVFLVVTLGVANLGPIGFGGVSVTSVSSIETCNQLKQHVVKQIHNTARIKRADSDEYNVQCVIIKEDNM